MCRLHGLLLLLGFLLGGGLRGSALESQQVREGRVLLLLGLLGERGPERVLLGHPTRVGFGAFVSLLGRLGVYSGLLCRVEQLHALAAQLLQLLLERRRGALRCARRYEGTWLEASILTERPMEPDRQLAGDLECTQGITVIAQPSWVARLPTIRRLVEQIEHVG